MPQSPLWAPSLAPNQGFGQAVSYQVAKGRVSWPQRQPKTLQNHIPTSKPHKWLRRAGQPPLLRAV